MATSGVFTVSNNSSGTDTRIKWTVTENKSANQTNVKVELQAKTIVGTFGSGSWVLKLGGSSYTRSGTFTGSSDWSTVVSADRTYTHEADGSYADGYTNVGVTSGGVSGTSWTTTSGTANITMPDYNVLPSAPRNVVATSSDSGSFDVDWDIPSNTAGGITNYQVQYDSSGSTFPSPGSFTTGSTSAGSYNSATPGRKYWIRVRAKASGDWGPWSSTVTVTVQYDPPSAPRSLTVTATSATSISATWALPSDTGGGILEYEYQYLTTTNWGSTTYSTGTTRSFTRTGLAANTRYYVRVRARGSGGWGPWSSVASATTYPSTAPGISGSSLVLGTGISVSLSPPAGATTPTSYEVQWRVSPSGSVTTVTTTSVSTTISGLTPGTAYDIRARAVYGSYTTPYSSWLTVTTNVPVSAAGTYFDGDTDPSSEATYRWTGTAGASTSEAVAAAPKGWIAYAGPNLYLSAGPTGTALYGSHVATATVLGDQTEEYVWGGIVDWETSAEIGEYIDAEGSLYVMSTVEVDVFLRMNWWDENFNIRDVPVDSATVTVPAFTPTRLVVEGTSPQGTAWATIDLVVPTGQLTSGDQMFFDGAMITLQSGLPYFDGSFTDTTSFSYVWLGDAHDSPSQRTTATSALPGYIAPITDPDCIIPDPPRPPVVPDDCAAFSGKWRRYWVRIPEESVADWYSEVPVITLTTGSEPERQIRIRFFENPTDSIPPAGVDQSAWFAEIDVSYMPPNTTYVIDGAQRRAIAWPTADPGSRQRVDHLLYGDQGRPATWPSLDCGDGYSIAIDVSLDSPQGNLQFDVEVVRRRA